MRGVASTEPNQKLQNTYFLYAQKQEQFEKERDDYFQCEKKSQDLIEESQKLLISPLRVRARLHHNESILAVYDVCFV
jgi:hypothetical protein